MQFCKSHESHKIKGKIVNGQPQIDVTIRVEGNIGEVECMVDLGKNQTIDMLQEEVSKEIMNAIQVID
ncbi:Ger(x)C family spore germination C-terminal domain-containing protein [Paenibacillus lignilyticus]|uniref:Spore germination GerAC-like C-terminal domain-containing protein n=1 Tax=Paenibacillus lignilyticus TaxID=1172615 RepID=A0ABS5C9S9_9BACL|nr:hypothetical protein [Paenibacillus lignilyticus]